MARVVVLAVYCLGLQILLGEHHTQLLLGLGELVVLPEQMVLIHLSRLSQPQRAAA
jgi:hypothetical protein